MPDELERRQKQRRSEPRTEHVEEVGKIVDRALINPSGAISDRRSGDGPKMNPAIQHDAEADSNGIRAEAARIEPKSLRTYTPSQAVLAKSAGVFHWTPEGRRLFDFSSGVLVANLGHNPLSWTRRFFRYLGWDEIPNASQEYFSATALTAYNAITPIEVEASRRLAELLQERPGGKR